MEITMQILGWLIWCATCWWATVCLLAFYYELRYPKTLRRGPEAFYPVLLRRLIMGFAALGPTAFAAITAITSLSKFTDISRFELLLLVPGYHFFGIHRWIEQIYRFWPSLTKMETHIWDCVPSQIVCDVKKTIGEREFENLTRLAIRYRPLVIKLLSDPNFVSMESEIARAEIAQYLSLFANDLLKCKLIGDAESAFRIIIALDPSQFYARGMLAVIYKSSGRILEARELARKAVLDMDSERGTDLGVLLDEMAEQNGIQHELNNLRSLFQSIVECK
jgi:hypothetical protein